MIAIANCVKLLAVPGPTPGPCEAKAAPAHDRQATIAVADIRCLVRDDAVTISCGEKLSEDTDGSLRWFWLAAVGALLVLAAPAERAQALSLSNPWARGAGPLRARRSHETRAPAAR